MHVNRFCLCMPVKVALLVLASVAVAWSQPKNNDNSQDVSDRAFYLATHPYAPGEYVLEPPIVAADDAPARDRTEYYLAPEDWCIATILTSARLMAAITSGSDVLKGAGAPPRVRWARAGARLRVLSRETKHLCGRQTSSSKRLEWRYYKVRFAHSSRVVFLDSTAALKRVK